MSQTTGRQVFVALPQASPLSEIATLKLLSQAEIDLSTVQFIHTENDVGSMKANDALVVLLVDQAGADPKLEMATLAAARAGLCHVIGVWAPGQTETGIHPSGLMFSTAQVPWDADKLKGELGSDCENVFQTPTGKTADPNEVDPNECE